MKYVDDSQVMQLLNLFPKNIKTSAIRSSARKALKPVVKDARMEIEKGRSKWQNSSGKDAFPHINFLKRYTKSFTIRDKVNPGAYVTVKGPEVPMGDRYWPITFFGLLMAKGATGRSTKGGANRGDFEGIGDFVQAGFNKNKNSVLRSFREGIIEGLAKARDRTVKRAKKRGFI
ncbi:MAG: hypothetical protein NXI20_17850 [bacterium]|nr:hypothetical protein [bacterium]